MSDCKVCSGTGKIERDSPYCTICGEKCIRKPPYLVDEHNKRHYFCSKCFYGYEGSKVGRYTMYSALRILRKLIGKNKHTDKPEKFYSDGEIR